MAIYTRSVILNLIKQGKLKISPFDEKNIGPGSIDLTLSNQIREFKRVWETFDIKPSSDYTKITDVKTIKKYHILRPKESVIAITKETITLPEDIAGWLYTRSRYARIGLMATPSFVQPGSSNKPVVELFNSGNRPLALYPDTKVVQLILETTVGEAKYKGKFKEQKKI
ncbi:dCTP deaminase [Candidatus Woesearchaeota archaeon]|nr:dCTP deaminase [Candidatus Woesearchaeota archaeon]MBW3017976.1 dCTP deaminase [Candidatus Woesearchaeota archaeon]